MAWRSLPSDGPIGASPARRGIDPNIVWADASRWRDFVRPLETPPELIPVLLELREPASVAFAREVRRHGGTIPSIYEVGDSRYCTASITPEHCARLLRQSADDGPVRRFELQMPLIPGRPRPRGVPSTRPARPRIRSSSELLIGIIDSACPFANAFVRDADRTGTRILNLWMQDRTHDPRTAGLAGPPRSFGYGVQLTRPMLNRLIRDRLIDGSVDEERIYSSAGIDMLSRRLIHGGPMLDLLVGPRLVSARLAQHAGQVPNWELAGDASSRADVVFVQLPRDNVQDSSSAAAGLSILDGLRYILSCAGPRTKRIVVNIGEGSSRGSHDGNSIIEKAMRSLAAPAGTPEIFIVLAAGNSFDQARHVEFRELPRRQWCSTDLRLLPSSEAPAQVVVRIPAKATDAELRVIPPGGVPDPRGRDIAVAGKALAWSDPKSPACAVVFPAAGNEMSTQALISFAPTASADGGITAPIGDWRIQVRSNRGHDESVHLYVTRNAANLGGLLRGRQPRFIDGSSGSGYDPVKHLNKIEDDLPNPGSSIKRRGTLNSLATGASGGGVVVVGSRFVRATAQTAADMPTPYSSTGPAVKVGATNPRPGPDLLAPTDNSRAVGGLNVSGTIGAQRARVHGTSFAAPQASREIAEIGAKALVRPRPRSLLVRDDPTRSRLSGRIKIDGIPPGPGNGND